MHLFVAGGVCTVICDTESEIGEYDQLGATTHTVDQTNKRAVDKFFRTNKGPFDHVVCSTVPGENDMPYQPSIEAPQKFGKAPVQDQQPIDVSELTLIADAFHEELADKTDDLKTVICVMCLPQIDCLLRMVVWNVLGAIFFCLFPYLHF